MVDSYSSQWNAKLSSNPDVAFPLPHRNQDMDESTNVAEPANLCADGKLLLDSRDYYCVWCDVIAFSPPTGAGAHSLGH